MSNSYRDHKRMTVTLLSGFLGAGKTTLLQRMLRFHHRLPASKRGRLAVIVNDMGAINLDAEDIQSSRILQTQEELVEMHNGCICCTLRGDLLKTVKRLALESHPPIDHLVIESTGISEPLPVAQTFVTDIDQEGGNNTKDDGPESLFHYARLDTLVTVVDALNLFDVLGSVETLADQNNSTGMKGNDPVAMPPALVEEHLQRQRAHAQASLELLSTEGLRAACRNRGLPTTGTRDELRGHLSTAYEQEARKRVEPIADDRSIAKLWLDQIEFANVLVISKVPILLRQHHNDGAKRLHAILALLRKLNPDAKVVVSQSPTFQDLDVDKTLWNTNLFDAKKAQESPSWIRELTHPEEHTPETEEYGISSVAYQATEMPFHPERFHKIYQALKHGEGGWSSALSTNNKTGQSPANSPFHGVVRIKGRVWLANSKAYPLEFHSAGKHVEVYPSSKPYLIETPRQKWTADDCQRHQEMLDQNLWTASRGDKRTRLVVIGVGLDSEAIRAMLDAALLRWDESDRIGGTGFWHTLNDPFYRGRLQRMSEAYSRSFQPKRKRGYAVAPRKRRVKSH